MSSKDQIEIFDDFINGNLSNEDSIDFKNRLSTDSKFSEVNCNVFNFSLEKLMRNTDTVTVY